MMAGMAGYIFKNKMRPRPEWQKNAVPAADPSNPFRILPMKTVEVDVTIPESGTLVFSCKFHGPLGMNGQLATR